MRQNEIEKQLQERFMNFGPSTEELRAMCTSDSKVLYDIQEEQTTKEPEKKPVKEETKQEPLIFEKKTVQKQKVKTEPIVNQSTEHSFDNLATPVYKRKESEKCTPVKKQDTPKVQTPKTPVMPLPEQSDIKQSKAPQHPPTQSMIDEVEDCEIFLGDIDETILFVKNHPHTEGTISHEKEPSHEEQQSFRVNKENESSQKFEMPKFEMPHITIPKIKLPGINISAMKRIAVKAAAFVIMLTTIVGVPLAISKQHTNDSNLKQSISVLLSDLNKRKQDTASITQNTEIEPTTEITLETLSTSTDLSEVAQSSEETVNTNSRFQTLEDLTLYISSQQGVILSKEKTLLSHFRTGNIAKETFLTEMQTQTDLLDDINHLLTVNKELYTNQNQLETYETLTNNIETIMIFGDKAIYEAKQTPDTSNYSIESMTY